MVPPLVRRISLREADEVWDGLVAEHLNPQRDGDWYGAFDDGRLVGVLHYVDVEGIPLLDDLWIRPERRNQGLGTTLVADLQRRATRLWLICDPPEVAYYARLGFREDALPRPLERRYSRLGQWPGHLDHVHVGMRWERPAAGSRPSKLL